MVGRGTDIILGGNWKAKLAKLENPTPEDEARLKAQWEQDHEDVLQAGGLHIIGSERHESRRIDNQLRGRAVVRVTLVFLVSIYLLKMTSCVFSQVTVLLP